ncbi:propionate catabolism operon regulatory protein PrpR [Acidovorax sp. CCYZU-2555]|uniref:propionate catabolism operon regulatory protein PrpR n=1 Tax=Acidovorax sp. CCYZU-2555 TaxID=2835042 RepID=UPI001BCE12EC|nr:propionate catabolism operon regulatory protein PrpR [Acidovorax sp. CCYZU-2555]MBS7776743.1 propionate catabolism operon regulatory protein PrpR [Acidovorax sp. CCYZU-2555]
MPNLFHAVPTRSDLPCVLVVSAYELADVALSVAPQFQGRAQIRIERGNLDRGVELVKKAIAQDGVEVVVSAGSNASYLRSRIDAPLVTVRVGGFDIMAALATARAAQGDIALVFFREIPDDVARFLRNYDLPVQLHAYESEAHAHALVEQLAASGVTAIVGPGVAVRAAHQRGLRGVLLYSRDSIAAAIEDAIQLVISRRAERSERERLAAVLRHLDSGVVATDAQGLILAANPAADALTGVALTSAVGQPLQQWLAALDPLAVQGSDDAARVARVQEWAQRKVLVHGQPIMESGRPNGAVFTLERSSTVEQAFRKLRAHERERSRPARYTLAHVVQASAQMQAVVRRCETVAALTEAPVLITGATGVGKELIAQGIHSASRRRGQRFVAVNCGALTESLLESELFGYEDGAFTGARREGKAGLFEAAHRGTVFLDEIGELPFALQTRLLRVLQEREVTRVGANAPVAIDIRVLAATHRDLAAMVRTGRFREDLYFRIAVLRIDLAPLAERPEDLQVLADMMVQTAMREIGLAQSMAPVLRLLPAVVARHRWPGNARELHNFAQRVAVRCVELASTPDLADLMALIDLPAAPEAAQPAADASLATERTHHELRHIQQVLADCDGDQNAAAKALGISRTTLWRRLKGSARG